MALVSSLTLQLDLEIGRLRVIPIVDFTLQRPLHLMTLDGKPPSPAAAEFLRLLRASHAA